MVGPRRDCVPDAGPFSSVNLDRWRLHLLCSLAALCRASHAISQLGNFLGLVVHGRRDQETPKLRNRSSIFSCGDYAKEKLTEAIIAAPDRRSMNDAKHIHGKAHTIHSRQQHTSWDNARPPAVTIAPGDLVTFKDIDAMPGQIVATSTVDALSNIDFSRVNPIAGPVYVDRAEAGDTLKVVLVGFEASGWGWTGIIPGFGLLAEEFPKPALHIWSYDKAFRMPAAYGSFARVPLKPFCGTTGVVQETPGSYSTIPPYATGGNMDIRDLSEGVELYLPVRVKGALFSIGDPHVAQGDGEVCGSAIESPMSVTARIDLIKGGNLRFPRFTALKPVSRHLDSKGYDVTTGIGPDLMEASKNAVRGMIDLLGKTHGLSAENAYMLCSVCADLRISEIVDRPNWVVSLYLPRIVFE
jgi:acetamidase/formamidase